MLLACVLAAYFPYLTDYFSLGVDTSYHLLRIEASPTTSTYSVPSISGLVRTLTWYTPGSSSTSPLGDGTG